MDKASLRTQILERRRQLSPSQIAALAKILAPKLISLSEVEKATCIGLYWSLPDEVPTHDLAVQLKALGKRVCLPRMDSDQGPVTMSEFFAMGDLERGPFQIAQPSRQSPQIDLKDISALIIPGVAFDIQGGRLGWGMGFYDKLLEAFTGYRLGLAFELQLVPEVPLEKWDQKVHGVLTEKDFYEVDK